MVPLSRLARPLVVLVVVGAAAAGCSRPDGSVVVRSVTAPSASPDGAPVAWRVSVDSRVSSPRYGTGDTVLRVTCTVRREREPRVFLQEARWPVGEGGARHRDVIEVVADADVAARVDPAACEIGVELWGLPRPEDLPASDVPTAVLGTLLDQVTVRP